jgi:isopenicillin-N N-acyltransferase-like protein
VSHTFPLIEVSGDAYQLGYQHGKQAATLVHRYLLWIQKLTRKPLPELRVNAARFLPFIESLSPAYVSEIIGLADGAGISFEEALLCQARAEASHTWEGGCTAFALTRKATADGHTLAGQNQDLETEYSDVAILLKVIPTDGRPRALMFTFAGQLGYSGMNEFGVATFTNSLYNFRWKPGLPFYPLKRVMLEKRTAKECVELMRAQRTCSAANLVICDAQGNISDLECRPEGAEVFLGRNESEILHTNHYITRRFAPQEGGFLPDSFPRLSRIGELVKQSWGKITVDTMKEILADHDGNPSAICRHGARDMHTISGYIAEPAKGLLHVRKGHGCDGRWISYQV